MSTKRKPADARRKDLELAISRIQRGRAHTKATAVNISTVAAEAGVTPALIHNHYPSIAERIRELQARSSRAQRDAKHDELKATKERNRALREELDALRDQVAKLASINEVLVVENRILKAKRGDPKVTDIGIQRS
ncbi:MAG: TetR family transcriptional regulator [Lysobacteraceae bacterium]|nr:MAG: TetR family transcriptional regulator [Xanthomonadaceae bacterium]